MTLAAARLGTDVAGLEPDAFFLAVPPKLPRDGTATLVRTWTRLPTIRGEGGVREQVRAQQRTCWTVHTWSSGSVRPLVTPRPPLCTTTSGPRHQTPPNLFLRAVSPADDFPLITAGRQHNSWGKIQIRCSFLCFRCSATSGRIKNGGS